MKNSKKFLSFVYLGVASAFLIASGCNNDQNSTPKQKSDNDQNSTPKQKSDNDQNSTPKQKSAKNENTDSKVVDPNTNPEQGSKKNENVTNSQNSDNEDTSQLHMSHDKWINYMEQAHEESVESIEKANLITDVNERIEFSLAEAKKILEKATVIKLKMEKSFREQLNSGTVMDDDNLNARLSHRSYVDGLCQISKSLLYSLRDKARLWKADGKINQSTAEGIMRKMRALYELIELCRTQAEAATYPGMTVKCNYNVDLGVW